LSPPHPYVKDRYVHTEAAKIALFDPKIQKSNSPVACNMHQ